MKSLSLLGEKFLFPLLSSSSLFVSYFHFTDEQIYYVIVFEDFAPTRSEFMGQQIPFAGFYGRASMLKYGRIKQCGNLLVTKQRSGRRGRKCEEKVHSNESAG